MKMEYVAHIIRGWPVDGSIDHYEVIADGATLRNGDWVELSAGPTGSVVDKVGAAITVTGARPGLVMRGNGDAMSCRSANKAEVVWSNFTVQLQEPSFNPAAAWVPGSPVTVKNGMADIGVPGTDTIIGNVRKVVSASSTETAHIEVTVN